MSDLRVAPVHHYEYSKKITTLMTRDMCLSLLRSADFKTDFSNRHSALELSISTESDPGPAPQVSRWTNDTLIS